MPKRIRVGDWLVEPELGRITKGDQHKSLQPREIDVLVYLSERAREVVSTEELIEHVWAGVSVAQDSVYVAISQIRRAFGEEHGESNYIKTLPKHGYRLMAPVEILDPKKGKEGQIKSGGFFGPVQYAVALGLVVIIAVALLYESPDTTPQDGSLVDEVKSIAVMSFLDLSPEGDQEYLADGFADQLLNTLAGIEGLRVMARTSSFSFKDKPSTVQEIGQILAVATVLEGSLVREGNRIHVTAQLVNAADGFHIWSDSYERDVADLFEIQGEIARNVAMTLDLEIDETKPLRFAGTNSFEAFEHYHLGRHNMLPRGGGPLIAAVEHFEAAVELDPGYAAAHAQLAITYQLLPWYAAGFATDEMAAKALPHIERALELDSNIAEPHAAMGYYFMETGAPEEALVHFEKAININPSLAIVHSWRSLTLRESLGRYAEAFESLLAGARVDPLSPPIVANLAQFYVWRGESENVKLSIEKLEVIAPQFAAFLSEFSAEVEGRYADHALFWLEQLGNDPAGLGRDGLLESLNEHFGLYEEALRLDRSSPLALLQVGRRAEALASMEDLLADNSANLLVRRGYARFMSAAGEYSRTVRIYDEDWARRTPATTGESTFGNLTEFAAYAAAKRQTGEEAGTKEVLDVAFTIIDRIREAAFIISQYELEEGLILYLSGREEEGLKLIRQGAARGYVDSFDFKQFPTLYSDPRSAEIKELMATTRARERAKFLTIVCNDNPAAEVWTPMEETCQGYVRPEETEAAAKQ